jgi:hypothetical protein
VSNTIQCFLLVPSDLAREYLRRFAAAECPGKHGYHDMSVEIAQVPYVAGTVDGDNFDHSDPRWPQRCECGYVPSDDDSWRHGFDQIYSRQDTGELFVLAEAPVGAMWYADWYLPHMQGPDGRCLVVKTPGGEWSPDSKSANSGTPWVRTGTPPRVTATPSIGQGPGRGPGGGYVYHGWLRDGQLVEC